MNIRIANIHDAKVITNQNIALAKESENIILKPEIVLAGVKSLLSDTNKGLYLVAEKENTIIGQLMIMVEWSDWRNKPIWWIQSVYVQKKWRKKGVFTQLLTCVQQLAREQKVAFLRLYVHQNNKSALQVYKRTRWYKETYAVYHYPL